MFPDPTKKTKLLIVHSDQTAVFANYLQMLISQERKDSDILIETAIWNIKQYLDQKPQISSREHILFIGRSKEIQDETYGMNTEFLRDGMTYGWLGKRGFMKVHGDSLKKNDLIDLLQFAYDYKPELIDEFKISMSIKINDNQQKGKLKQIDDLIRRMFSTVQKDDYYQVVRGFQYKTLTLAFYTDGLPKFIQS